MRQVVHNRKALSYIVTHYNCICYENRMQTMSVSYIYFFSLLFFSLPSLSPLPSSIFAGAVDHLGIEFMGKKKKALSYWHSDESCLESLYEPRWLCICFVQSCFSFYCMCLNVNVPVISFDCALYGPKCCFPFLTPHNKQLL